jgi:hypothetical protein
LSTGARSDFSSGYRTLLFRGSSKVGRVHLIRSYKLQEVPNSNLLYQL